MQNRRETLKQSAVVAGLLATAGFPQFAQAAFNKAAFDAKSVQDSAKAAGATSMAESKDVTITGPDIAENGAVVPVGVATSMPKTQQIAILVEKNPSALAAQFIMTPDTEPFVASRVKMGQTSNVHALVKADGQWFVSTKEVKVTLGGCGG